MKTHIIYVYIFRSYKSTHAHGLALISTLQPAADLAFTDWRLKKLWTPASPLTFSHLHPIHPQQLVSLNSMWVCCVGGSWALVRTTWHDRLCPNLGSGLIRLRALLCIGDLPQCLTSHSRFPGSSKQLPKLHDTNTEEQRRKDICGV